MTRRQSELLGFLKAQADQGRVPTFREMKEHLGLKSTSGVHRLIASLEEQGKIHRTRNRARRIAIAAENFELQHVATADLMMELVNRGFSIARAGA